MRAAPFVLALAAAGIAALAGCGGPDNDRIRVKNRTVDQILVRYDEEYVYASYDTDGDGVDDEDDVRTHTLFATVAAGGERDLSVADGFWSARIDVLCRGTWRIYRTSVDVVGVGTIWVRDDDFPPEAPVANG